MWLGLSLATNFKCGSALFSFICNILTILLILHFYSLDNAFIFNNPTIILFVFLLTNYVYYLFTAQKDVEQNCFYRQIAWEMFAIMFATRTLDLGVTWRKHNTCRISLPHSKVSNNSVSVCFMDCITIHILCAFINHEGDFRDCSSIS